MAAMRVVKDGELVLTKELMSELLTPAEAASILGRKESTLQDWRIDGKGPAYIEITSDGVNIVRHTADPAGSRRRGRKTIRYVRSWLFSF